MSLKALARRRMSNIGARLLCMPRKSHRGVKSPQWLQTYALRVGNGVSQIFIRRHREQTMRKLKTLWSAPISLALGLFFLGAAPDSASATCQLKSPGGKLSRVVYIIFDNVHLRRDNPNVPSDLEQM